MAKSCDTCCSRYICFMKDKTPCACHNDKAMFIQMLYAIEPNINWERRIAALEEKCR